MENNSKAAMKRVKNGIVNLVLSLLLMKNAEPILVVFISALSNKYMNYLVLKRVN